MKLNELKIIARDSGYKYSYSWSKVIFTKGDFKRIAVNLHRRGSYEVSIEQNKNEKDFNLIYAAEEFSKTEIRDRGIRLKTNELINAINNSVVLENEEIRAINQVEEIIVTFESEEIAKINKHVFGQFNNNYDSWNNLSNGIKRILLGMIYDYIMTPATERDDERRYYLIHKFLRGDKSLGYPAFLLQDVFTGLVYTSNLDIFIYPYKEYRIKFTNEELEEVKKENKTDLREFIWIAATEKNEEILSRVHCEADFNIKDFEEWE